METIRINKFSHLFAQPDHCLKFKMRADLGQRASGELSKFYFARGVLDTQKEKHCWGWACLPFLEETPSASQEFWNKFNKIVGAPVYIYIYMIVFFQS